MEQSTVKWGHYAALVILSALAASYRPHYLIYVGLLRWAWCILGGRPGRGFASAFVFLVAYASVVFTGFLRETQLERQVAEQPRTAYSEVQR